MQSSSRVLSLIIICALYLLAPGCAKKESAPRNAAELSDTLLTFVKVVDKKTYMDKCWSELSYIKEYYKQRIAPPDLKTDINLSSLGYQELWFLKYSILARNGYLFQEPNLRAYFNQFPWYQPIYEDNGFITEVTKSEYEFLKQIITEEKKQLAHLITSAYSIPLVDYNFCVNQFQYKNMAPAIIDNLKNKNMVIIHAHHDQLFSVYEGNTYEYIPSFVTTDLFMQSVQKHISTMLQDLEKQSFIPLVTQMLNSLYSDARTKAAASSSSQVKDAAEWCATYYAIAYTLLTDKPLAVAPEYVEHYNSELYKCRLADGNNSPFLQAKLAEYSQFKPRGNYSSEPIMERYFRSIKWLNSAKIVIPDTLSLAKPVMMAYLLNKNRSVSSAFQRFSDAVSFLTGEENNISIAFIASAIAQSYPAADAAELLQKSTLTKLYQHLKARDPRRFQIPVGTAFAKTEYAKMTVLFSAGRYLLDNEVYARLVQYFNQKQRRVLPKALDVFAAAGNSLAESLLVHYYQEPVKWPGYTDSLTLMKGKLANKKVWDNSIYDKSLQTIFSLGKTDSNFPLFMKTKYWDMKNLNTSLAAYTQLKHDMVLYSEEIVAAECGGGYDGPPPPMHLGYVEPNIRFWKNSLALLQLLKKRLTDLELITEKVTLVNNILMDLNTFLLNISEKELAGTAITEKEFDRIDGIGGELESITLKMLGSDILPDRERRIAQVMNVFGYRDSTNRTFYLNEAIGEGDEIFVIAFINGLPYICKGAVWSYYEFESGTTLIDAEWRTLLDNGTNPQVPNWMKDIRISAPSPQTKNLYQFQ